MATTQGVAIAWGDVIDTASAVGSIKSTGTTFKYEADTHDVKDSVGNIIGRYYYNYRKSLSLSCWQYNSSGMTTTPQPGTGCTVTVMANVGDTEIADADYIVESCTKERAPDAMGKFSLDLVAYDQIDAA